MDAIAWNTFPQLMTPQSEDECQLLIVLAKWENHADSERSRGDILTEVQRRPCRSWDTEDKTLAEWFCWHMSDNVNIYSDVVCVITFYILAIFYLVFFYFRPTVVPVFSLLLVPITFWLGLTFFFNKYCMYLSWMEISSPLISKHNSKKK